MNRLRHILSIVIATAASALAVTSSGSAKPPPIDGPFTHQNWARAPQNAAGVVFQPYGDDFEIWDNVRDGKSVTVWYKYLLSSRWHKIVSHVHVGTYRRNMRERPQNVAFVIDGHDRNGRFVRSHGSYYRTWGR